MYAPIEKERERERKWGKEEGGLAVGASIYASVHVDEYDPADSENVLISSIP